MKYKLPQHSVASNDESDSESIDDNVERDELYSEKFPDFTFKLVCFKYREFQHNLQIIGINVYDGEKRIAVLKSDFIMRTPENTEIFMQMCDTKEHLVDVALECLDIRGNIDKLGKLYALLKPSSRSSQASKGGLIYLDEVHVDPEYRGKDLGLELIRIFLEYLEDEWTLAITIPASNDTEERNRDYMYPTYNFEKQCEKTERVAKHLCRMGFKQFSYDGYFFLDKHAYNGIQPPLKEFSMNHVPKTRDTEIPICPIINLPLNPITMTPIIMERTIEDDLVDAVQEINIPLIKRLVKSGADVNSAHALEIAVVRDLGEDLVRILCDLGANPNHPNISGSTPLHIAASEAKLNYIQLLILLGAKPDILDRLMNSPLDCYNFKVKSSDGYGLCFWGQDDGKKASVKRERKFVRELLKV